MSTRSSIWIKNQNNFEGIYCHFDGNIVNGVGEMLYKHYNTEEKVKEMIAHGACSYLEEDIASSRFYHSWRGEDLSIYSVSDLVFAKDYFEEFNYLFDKGEWYIMYKNGKKPLSKYFKKE